LFLTDQRIVNRNTPNAINLNRFSPYCYSLTTYFFCFIIFYLFLILPCTAQNWLWSKSAIGSRTDEGISVSADASGNVFFTGYFYSPTITFGSITLINADTSTTDDGFDDVFVAKYDANGNVLWAKCAGGINYDEGYSVSADANGNAFVAGYFYSTAITFGTTTLINADTAGITQDVFIAKYDANGNVLWAKRAGGINYDEGYSVSADANGNVYLTGYFYSPTITFGNTTLTNADTSGNSDDLFIVKYDLNGNILWAKRAGGLKNDEGYSLSADANGNVLLTGYFSSPTISFGNTTLTNADPSGITDDIFIAKYDSSGNVLWAKSVGGTNYDYGYSVSADASGNAFITGAFESSSITFGSTTLTNAASEFTNVFIAKYDSNGNFLWAKSAGGTQQDAGYSISADANGNAFVTGSFYSSQIIFGSDTLTPPAGSADPMFIVKYDANGNVLCASALSSGGDDQNGVSADAFGNAYIGGDFEANPFIVGTDTLSLIGGENVFVAKYKCNNTNTVNELIGRENVEVYPNPTNGVFRIQMDNGKLSIENYQLSIYNVLGECINQQIIKSPNQQIDLSFVPNGIYFLQLLNSDGIISKKIMVEK
jgi:hypothetical protein